MSLPEECPSFEEPLSPIGRTQSGLAESFITPSQKKNGDGNQFVNEKPFINNRKPASMLVAKSNFNSGEHMLILIMAKMIHSAVSKCQRLVLKDS
jgi:hypothetical protein